MASGEGFEPPQTDSESAVLPLDQPEVCLKVFCIKNRNCLYSYKPFSTACQTLHDHNLKWQDRQDSHLHRSFETRFWRPLYPRLTTVLHGAGTGNRTQNLSLATTCLTLKLCPHWSLVSDLRRTSPVYETGASLSMLTRQYKTKLERRRGFEPRLDGWKPPVLPLTPSPPYNCG